MSPTKLQQILSGSDLSNTRPRFLIVEKLFVKGPLSAVELHRELAGSVDRATIYRTINCLQEAGLIQQVSLGWKNKFKLGDSFKSHHHHAVCLKCENVIEFTQARELELAIENLSKNFDFRVVSHRFELEVVCQRCSS